MADFISKKASSQLNASLKIDHIEGNFLNHIAIKNISLVSQQDTLAFIPQITLSYSLEKVLKKEIIIHSFSVESAKFYISQLPDSSWNFQHLFSRDSQKETKKSNPISFKIKVDLFELDFASISFSAIDSLVPQSIRNINLNLAAEYSKDFKKVSLKQLEFETVNPDFVVKALSFDILQDTTGIVLDRFMFRSAKNQIAAQAYVDRDRQLNATGHLAADSIDLDEMSFLLPALKLTGKPNLFLNTKLLNDSLNLKVELAEQKQSIGINVFLTPFSQLLADSSREKTRLFGECKLNNIIISPRISKVKSDILINSIIQFHAEGISPHNTNMVTNAHFFDCSYDSLEIAKLDIDAKFNNSNLFGELGLASDFGHIKITASIEDVFKRQKFQVQSDFRHLNIAKYISQDSTNLNFTLNIEGNKFDINRMKAQAQINFSPSAFNAILVDTINGSFSLSNKQITIDTFDLSGLAAEAHVSGFFNPEGASDLQLALSTKDPTALKELINADTLSMDARLYAHLYGARDSLIFSSKIDVSKAQVNTLAIDSLSCSTKGTCAKNKITSDYHIDLTHLNVNDISIKNITSYGQYTKDTLTTTTDITLNENIDGSVVGQYLFSDTPAIIIDKLNLKVYDTNWQLADKSEIKLKRQGLNIDNFLLESYVKDKTAAKIYADGDIIGDEEDFHMQIEGLDISPFESFIKTDSLNGKIAVDMKLHGTDEKPMVNLSAVLKNVHYKNYWINTIEGQLNYADDNIQTQVVVTPQNNNLYLKGTVPFHFSIKEKQAFILKDKQLFLEIDADQFPIRQFIVLENKRDQLSGFLNCNIKTHGSFEHIIPTGQISLTNCKAVLSKAGVNIDDSNIKIRLDPDKLVLEQLVAKNDKGSLKAAGYAQLDTSKSLFSIKDSQININSDRFLLSNNPNHEVQINSNIQLSGPLQAPKISGTLDIIRSSFNTRVFSPNKQTFSPSQMKKSLLVEALSQEDNLSKGTIIKGAQEKKHRQLPSIIQNLRVSIKVKIPKNTWIKGENMRFEIAGDFDVVKNSENFELFGFIKILRGHYDFLARRFKMEQGEIIFQGGEKLNPQLNIKTEYTFRDPSREKHSLNLFISENVLEPKFRFTLDNKEITEGEAVSYILFNRSPEELTSGQQSSVASSSINLGQEYIATDLVSGLLSSQLTNKFGNKFGVDFIEIRGKNNWQSATLILGKYVTDNIFMSYEHSLGTLEEDMPPQVVTLEYEIIKNLFLQFISGDTKTSGADLIIKLEK